MEEIETYIDRGTGLTNKNKQEVLERTNRLLSLMTRTTLNTTRPTILLLLRVHLLPR
jgi:hypothetical protein